MPWDETHTLENVSPAEKYSYFEYLCQIFGGFISPTTPPYVGIPSSAPRGLGQLGPAMKSRLLEIYFREKLGRKFAWFMGCEMVGIYLDEWLMFYGINVQVNIP